MEGLLGSSASSVSHGLAGLSRWSRGGRAGVRVLSGAEVTPQGPDRVGFQDTLKCRPYGLWGQS